MCETTLQAPACQSGIALPRSLNASQIRVNTYLAGRCRPSEGEFIPLTLAQVMGAHGDAAELAEVLRKIPMSDKRKSEKEFCWTLAEWGRRFELWIPEASEREHERLRLVQHRDAALSEGRDADADAADTALDSMKKRPDGKRITPTGIGFESHAVGPDGRGLLLLDIDIDLTREHFGELSALQDKLARDPHVMATWVSRRGYGVHGVYVCNDDPASYEVAVEKIKRDFPGYDPHALKPSHGFIALPGHVWDAVPLEANTKQKAAYEAREAEKARNRAALAADAARAADNDRAWYLAQYITSWLPSDCAKGHLGHADALKVASRCGNFLRCGNDTAPGTVRHCAELIAGATDGHETIRAIERQIEHMIEHGNEDPITEATRQIEAKCEGKRGRKTAGAALTTAPSLATKAENTDTEKPEKGRKKATLKQQAAAWFAGYKYDTFRRVMICPDGTETTVDDAASKLYRENEEICSLSMAKDVGEAFVMRNPATAYDGFECRIKELARDYTNADGGSISRYCARCGFDAYESRRIQLWLYQICAKGVMRGEKTDGMLVLSGQTEGTKKSTFFNAICQCLVKHDAPEYQFGGNKADAELLLTTSPIVVIDEIDKILIKGVDVAEIKTKITSTGSTVRASYDRQAKPRKNSAVFGATTNDEKPIPAGEGAARRYWIIHVENTAKFNDMAEVEAIMREAAHDTLAELEAHKNELDLNNVIGKIWVESDAEARETAQRNGGLKVEDAPTIAIQTALRVIADYAQREAPRLWNDVFRISDISAAIETGEGEVLGAPSLHWKAPRTSAQAISRTLRARKKSAPRTQRVAGGITKGCRFADIAAEFCPELHPYIPNDEFFD